MSSWRHVKGSLYPVCLSKFIYIFEKKFYTHLICTQVEPCLFNFHFFLCNKFRFFHYAGPPGNTNLMLTLNERRIKNGRF